MENPIKMDDLGVALFLETHKNSTLAISKDSSPIKLVHRMVHHHETSLSNVQLDVFHRIAIGEETIDV